MSSPHLKSARRAQRRKAQGGFTLLEFLVAFTVLTLFLTAGLSATGVALRGDQQAAFVTLATTLARAKLAAAGVDFPLRAGVSTGRFENGYLWQARVRSYRTAATSPRDTLQAFWVEVTVSDPHGNGRRSLSLASVELAREPR